MTEDQKKLVKKQVTDFSSTPDVQRIMEMKATEKYDPEVNETPSDPVARSYAERVQQRSAQRRKVSSDKLKGKAPPLGHVAPPDSEKMESIAGLGNSAPLSPPPPPPESEQPQNQAPTMGGGVGAAYAVNQALSRGDTEGRPVTLREGNKMTRQGGQGLSEESVQALKMAKENFEQQQSEPDEPSGETPEQETGEKHSPQVAKETKAELEEMEDELGPSKPPIDFGAIEDARTTLLDPERKKIIEARLEPLDIGEMIMKRELQQTVPVIPKKFEVTLRTFSQKENLWILHYLFNFPGSALYTQELLSTCRLVCSLVAINGKMFPEHRKNPGEESEVIIKEDFERKFYYLASYPVQFVADLSVQLMWFQERVDNLLSIDALKNG